MGKCTVTNKNRPTPKTKLLDHNQLRLLGLSAGLPRTRPAATRSEKRSTFMATKLRDGGGVA